MSEKMCKVVYLLNEKGRKASLLSGGNGKRIQIIEGQLTKELLNIAKVDDDGNAIVEFGAKNILGHCHSKIKLSTKLIDRQGFSLYEPKIEDAYDIVEFDKTQTVEELLNFEKNRVLEYNKSLELNKEKIKPLLEEYKIKKEEERIEKEKRETEKELRILQEKEKNEKLQELRKKEKEDDENWIKTNGSDYLKKCLELGYNCKRKYMEERVAKEFPEFELDFYDKSDWKDRVSPSEEAIEEVSNWLDKGFDAKIVWITKPIIEDDDYDWEYEFDCYEAIVINFKGYSLIKAI